MWPILADNHSPPPFYNFPPIATPPFPPLFPVPNDMQIPVPNNMQIPTNQYLQPGTNIEYPTTHPETTEAQVNNNEQHTPTNWHQPTTKTQSHPRNDQTPTDTTIAPEQSSRTDYMTQTTEHASRRQERDPVDRSPVQTPQRDRSTPTEMVGQRRRFDQITSTPESVTNIDRSRHAQNQEWKTTNLDETARNIDFEDETDEPDDNTDAARRASRRVNTRDYDHSISPTEQDTTMPNANNLTTHRAHLGIHRNNNE